MSDQRVGATYAPDEWPAAHGQDPADSTSERVKEQVKDTAEAAKDKAREVKQRARGRLSEQVDQRSTQAGERIASTAGDVRSVADELRRQDKHGPARLADQAADQAERVGYYLQSADGDRILRDVERYTRDNPWLVAGGALLVGFAASRFLKASSGRRYRSLDQGTYRPTADRAYGTPDWLASTPPAAGGRAGVDPYGAGSATPAGPTAVAPNSGAYPPPPEAAYEREPYQPEAPLTDPTWPDPTRPHGS